LAGMPRRIPDFPDSYAAWNTIASVGSIITMVSTVFFVYVIFSTFVANQRAGYNPWKNSTNVAI
jgi:heme/copper-type cytochrome/quinol oxidase subunit 1